MKGELLAEINERDSTITGLKDNVAVLQKKVSKLEELIDDSDAYERRDTIILNGPAVPNVTPQENCPSIVQDLVRNEFRLNMAPGDIRVSYNLENLENLELPGTRNLFNGTLVEGKCI